VVIGCYTVPTDKPPIKGMFPIVSLIVQDPFSKEVIKDEHPITIYEPVPELRVQK